MTNGAGPSFRHGVDLLIHQVLILIPEFYLIIGLVQLEVGIVGMRFIDAGSVLGGREVGIRADALRAIVHGPVVKGIG